MSLAEHINKLLLDNDCVIIPEIGGFITQYSSAYYDEERQCFIPPTRTIGFNSKLTVNDGLLVYSIMQERGITYNEAIKVVHQFSKEVLNTLHEKGYLRLRAIGILHLNLYGGLDFSPENEILCPQFLGLESFDMPLISQTAVPESSTASKRNSSAYEIKINRSLIHGAAAAIAAVILLFAMSTPVQNTYVEKGNFAQLMSINLFEQIEQHSMNITPITQTSVRTTCSEADMPSAQDSSSLKHIQVKEIKIKKNENSQVSPSTSSSVSENSSKSYNLIVAGGIKEDVADKKVEELKKSGYQQAHKIHSSGGLYRVSILSFSTRELAEKELNELRKNPSFKDAWLLVKRK